MHAESTLLKTETSSISRIPIQPYSWKNNWTSWKSADSRKLSTPILNLQDYTRNYKIPTYKQSSHSLLLIAKVLRWFTLRRLQVIYLLADSMLMRSIVMPLLSLKMRPRLFHCLQLQNHKNKSKTSYASIPKAKCFDYCHCETCTD